MPAPRKPLSMIQHSGTEKDHPGRTAARQNEPAPKPDTENETAIGPPPAYLSPYEKKMFREIVKTAHEGTLMHADRLFIAHGARLLSRISRNEDYDDMPLIEKYSKFLSMMGMTPTDRTRVSATPKPVENPFTNIAAMLKRAA